MDNSKKSIGEVFGITGEDVKKITTIMLPIQNAIGESIRGKRTNAEVVETIVKAFDELDNNIQRASGIHFFIDKAIKLSKTAVDQLMEGMGLTVDEKTTLLEKMIKEMGEGQQ